MTVYAYTRVSTLTQAQVRQVLAYTSSRALELTESDAFVERGVSGGQEFGSRPAGSKLLASLQSGDIVIFPKLDRGFRNTRDALNVLHTLKDKGVSVHSTDLGGDVAGNGVGAIIFTILSAFATFERERIASRISDQTNAQGAGILCWWSPCLRVRYCGRQEGAEQIRAEADRSDAGNEEGGAEPSSRSPLAQRGTRREIRLFIAEAST